KVFRLALPHRLRCIFTSSIKMKILPVKWRHLIAAVLLLSLGTSGLIFWRARKALRIAASEVQSQGSLPFTVRRLVSVNSGFEWIDAAESFTGGAVFKGDFYLCGASGIFRYDNHGSLIQHYRPGQELPSTPLLRMTTGILRDAREPELLIVTGTEGILAFNGEEFRQILPDYPDARAITSILPLGSGQLLIGTRKSGVLVYDGLKLQPFHPALAALHVTELAGNEGDLWIGTQDQGVVHWQAGRTELFGEAQGMPD